MKGNRNFDYIILISTMALVGIGIVMIYSASSIMAIEKFKDGLYFLKRQCIYAFIGIILMLGAINIPYTFWKKIAYPALGLSFVSLLALHFSSYGMEVAGSTRWLRFSGLSFQPSEFAKIAIVTYLAYSLSKKKDMIRRFSIGFLPHILIVSVFIFLIIKEPDLGMAVTIGIIAMIMMFVAGVRILYLIISTLIGSIFFVHNILNTGYQVDRILTFLNPWEASRGSGYQIVQSFIAFGSGGIFGTGLGEGKQKLFYLPEPHTDFIFSVIGEELGFIGVIVIVFLFILLIVSGIRVAIRARDEFAALFATGIVSIIAIGSIINLSVVLGLIPTKGLTLPFISYGGTSLVIHMICIGILFNISSHIEGRGSR